MLWASAGMETLCQLTQLLSPSSLFLFYFADYVLKEVDSKGLPGKHQPSQPPSLYTHTPHHTVSSVVQLTVPVSLPTDSSYSEPPDVQQQLNHYQSAALARNNSRVSPVPPSGTAAGTEQKAEAVLHCEFCEFSSGYIQSIRRHYRDKHGGKKLFKCKDCSFYTGFK